MKRSVLEYGSFTSGRKSVQKTSGVTNKNIEKLDQNPEKAGVLSYEDIPPVQEEPAPLEIVEAAEPVSAVEEYSEPAFEIPSAEEILHAGEEAFEPAAAPENVAAAPAEEQEIYLTSTTGSEDPEDVFMWEIPYYDDAHGKKRKASKVKAPKEKKTPEEKKAKKEKTPKQKKEKVIKQKKIKETDQKTKIKKTAAEKKEEKRLRKEEKAAEKSGLPPKTKRPIGVMLIAIISFIVIVSLSVVTVVVSKSTSEDTIINAQANNLTINSRVATDTDNRFNNVIASVETFYSLVESISYDENEVLRNSSLFFERNKEIGAVAFLDTGRTFVNRQYFVSNELDQEIFDAYLVQEAEISEMLVPGKSYIENSCSFFGTLSVAIFSYVNSSLSSDKAVILFSTEAMQDSLSTSNINLSFIVNDKGMVLVHPDISVIKSGADYSSNPVVERMLTTDENNAQFTYKDSSKNEIIGAFNKMKAGDCSVITEVQTEIILEGVKRTARRNIELMIAVLAISILMIGLFSNTLSRPLKTLTAVTNEIKQGNFDSELFDELDENRKDEIGLLIKSTKDERKMLDTFTRLTNKAVTKAVVREEIDFDPHLKDITVFFSDIRGFTAISDSFSKLYGDKSAAKIIGFLNNYMSRMVYCIAACGGTVDKFEGDAIMAAWGVLRRDSLDLSDLSSTDETKAALIAEHNEHILEDALNAVKASLLMRYSIMEYNREVERLSKNNSNTSEMEFPHIRFGAGINSGRATVGFMGSEDKMEYTSIGDAVNLASRTESANKPCGTDMLITENTYNILKKKYIKCEENNYTIADEDLKNEIIVEKIPVSFAVKGKENQHFYGIVNMPAFDVSEVFRNNKPDFTADPVCLKAVGPTGPSTLDEVRTLLGIQKPDFSGVNLNEEEDKVQIK